MPPPHSFVMYVDSNMEQMEYGASLYLPATRDDLEDIGRGDKIPEARSVIFCTEDAIRDDEVPAALAKLAAALPALAAARTPAAPLRLVRPRSPEVLHQVLRLRGAECLRGFVLPKFTLDTMEEWFRVLRDQPHFVCMPTLETVDAFDGDAMRRLRDALLASPQRQQVAVIRIGGLDLLNVLGIRRHCSRTIYDTALRHCLQQLVSIFIPAGFVLSAPAFECMEHHDTLRDEVELDMLNGLFLKSAIHPDQLAVVHEVYKASPVDVQVANALLAPDSPAAFRMDDRMCEKTTHANWARRTLLRAKLYGISAPR